MTAHIRSKKSAKRRPRVFVGVHKPRGTVHPRVQQVGPERFGVVSVDCAKARSVWMLCNFYGQVLLPPAELTHTQCHFQAALLLGTDGVRLGFLVFEEPKKRKN